MNLLYISLMILIIVGILLFTYGLKGKSQLIMYFGGKAIITPIIYLIGWTSVIPLVPPIALIISDLGKRKVKLV